MAHYRCFRVTFANTAFGGFVPVARARILAARNDRKVDSDSPSLGGEKVGEGGRPSILRKNHQSFTH